MSITARARRAMNFASNSTDPTVGPGSYELRGMSARNDSPFPFLTTAARFKDDPNPNPGPADYNPIVPRLNIHGSGATMRSASARKSWDVIESPSPCNYQKLKDWEKDTNGGQRRGRAPMSSRSQRSCSIENANVGNATPADYDLRPAYSRGVRMAKSARGALYRINDTPGPGEYEGKSKAPRRKALPSHEFLSSSERKVFNDQPLVDYDGRSQVEWQKPKGYAPFGSKAKRRNFWGVKKTPGPGQYNIENDRKHRKNSAPFGCRADRSWVEGNDNPGPGAYKPEGKKRYKDDNDKPFGHRSPRFEKVYRDNPNGPGQYEIDTGDALRSIRAREIASPAFKFNGERNPFPVDRTAPGPGNYSPEAGQKLADTRKLKKCIDGTERAKPGTFIGNPISDVPGPATYAVEKHAPRPKGGYVRHSRRGDFVRNTCAPSPDKYEIAGDMIKPSYNVTYSVCKL